MSHESNDASTVPGPPPFPADRGRRRRGGGRNRRHPGRAARARLRPGHQAPLGALGGLHPRVRRRAEAPVPEASKALGAEVRSRPSTPTTSSPASPPPSSPAPAPTSSTSSTTGRTCTRTPLVDVSDVADAWPRPQGGFYEVSEPSSRSTASGWRVPHSIVGDAVAYRKSWLKEAGATAVSRRPGMSPQGLREPQEEGQALRADPRPHLRRRAGVDLHPDLGLRRAGDRQWARRSSSTARATLEAVKFMTAFWKECCDEGGLAWDDTNNNRAFHAGEICATLNGASIYIVAKRRRRRSRTTRASRCGRTSTTRRCPPGPPGPSSYRFLPVHAVMKYGEEPEAGQGLPPLAPQARAIRQVVPGRRKATRSAPPSSGSSTPCGTRSTSR